MLAEEKTKGYDRAATRAIASLQGLIHYPRNEKPQLYHLHLCLPQFRCLGTTSSRVCRSMPGFAFFWTRMGMISESSFLGR